MSTWIQPKSSPAPHLRPPTGVDALRRGVSLDPYALYCGSFRSPITNPMQVAPDNCGLDRVAAAAEPANPGAQMGGHPDTARSCRRPVHGASRARRKAAGTASQPPRSTHAKSARNPRLPATTFIEPRPSTALPSTPNATNGPAAATCNRHGRHRTPSPRRQRRRVHLASIRRPLTVFARPAARFPDRSARSAAPASPWTDRESRVRNSTRLAEMQVPNSSPSGRLVEGMIVALGPGTEAVLFDDRRTGHLIDSSRKNRGRQSTRPTRPTYLSCRSILQGWPLRDPSIRSCGSLIPYREHFPITEVM